MPTLYTTFDLFFFSEDYTELFCFACVQFIYHLPISDGEQPRSSRSSAPSIKNKIIMTIIINFGIFRTEHNL